MKQGGSDSVLQQLRQSICLPSQIHFNVFNPEEEKTACLYHGYTAKPYGRLVD